jgi:hypothetical protein
MKKRIPDYIESRATKILEQLNATGFKGLHYKRLIANRNIFSISIGTKYRIIVRTEDDKYMCSEILSHADYNIRVKSRRH